MREYSSGSTPRAVETLYLSAITVAELHFGLLALRAGNRRKRLQQCLAREVLPLPRSRGAVRFAGFGGLRRSDGASTCPRQPDQRSGRPQGADCGLTGLVVATRATGPFRASGVDDIDPWDAVR